MRGSRLLLMALLVALVAGLGPVQAARTSVRAAQPSAEWTATPDAPILGSRRVAPALWQDTYEAAAPIGDHTYLVIWSSTRNWPISGTYDIYGLRVRDDGTLLGRMIPISTAAGDQWAPAVACSASGQSLVVWHTCYAGANCDIHGQRVDASGNPVGSEIAISTASDDQLLPRVAYNPHLNEYLVVWEGYSSGLFHIYGQRVAHDGTLTGGPILITSGSGSQLAPDVAYNPAQQRYAVVWSDTRSDLGDIYGQLLLDDGTPDGSENAVSVADNTQESPRIAANSSSGEWMVVWQDRRDTATIADVRARRLAADGSPSGDEIVIANEGRGEFFPAITHNPNTSQFLVSWYDSTVSPAGTILTRRINSDGSLAGAAVAASSTTADPYFTSAIAYDDEGATGTYLVLWRDFRDEDAGTVFARRVNDNGVMLASEFGISKWADQSEPALAYNAENDQYLLVWRDGRSPHDDIWARRLDGSGRPIGDDIFIASSATAQGAPAVAYSAVAHRYLIVWWRDQPTTGYDIWGQLVKADGSLYGSRFAIATATGQQQAPAVASSDSDWGYLVTWEDGRAGSADSNIYGRRVNNDGTLASSELPICTAAANQSAPAIAYAPLTGSDSDVYMVVWHDEYLAADNRELRGQLIDRTGALVGGLFTVVSAPAHQEEPDLAYHPAGGEFLVVYTQRDGSVQDIYGRRVGADGAPIAAPFPICTEAHAQFAASVAYSPSNETYLVAWQDARRSQADIYGRLVSAEGSMASDDFSICTAQRSQTRADVGYGSGQDEFLIVWADDRAWWHSADIYARRIFGHILPNETFMPLIRRQ